MTNCSCKYKFRPRCEHSALTFFHLICAPTESQWILTCPNAQWRFVPLRKRLHSQQLMSAVLCWPQSDNTALQNHFSVVEKSYSILRESIRSQVIQNCLWRTSQSQKVSIQIALHQRLRRENRGKQDRVGFLKMLRGNLYKKTQLHFLFLPSPYSESLI